MSIPITSPHSQHKGADLLIHYHTKELSALHNPHAFCVSGACAQAQPLSPLIPHVSETSNTRCAMQGDCSSLGAVSGISMAGLSTPGRLRGCVPAWGGGAGTREAAEWSRVVRVYIDLGRWQGSRGGGKWDLGEEGLLLHQASLQQAWPAPENLQEGHGLDRCTLFWVKTWLDG